METREELIQGLTFVKDKINQILKVKQRQVEIVANFRAEQAKVDIGSLKNRGKLVMCMALGVLVLFLFIISAASGNIIQFFISIACVGVVYALRKKKSKIKIAALLFLAYMVYFVSGLIVSTVSSGNIGLIILLVVLLALSVGLVLTSVWLRNHWADMQNAKIRAYNATIQEQYDETARELSQLSNELFKSTGSWYPRSYYSAHAVGFFLEAVLNYRAETVKELVNLYEDSEYKRKSIQAQQRLGDLMEQSLLNQEDIKKELQFANVIGMENLRLSAANLAATRENTAAIRQGSAAAQAAASATRQGVKSATDRISNEISKLRRR